LQVCVCGGANWGAQVGAVVHWQGQLVGW